MSGDSDIRLVVFGGDYNTGKSSIFKHRVTGQIPIIGNYCSKYERLEPEEFTFDQKTFRVVFDDHEGGGEDWHRLRHLGYINADTVVLCFPINSPDSFLRIKEFWYPFTQEHCPKAKLLLVGMKKDLRYDPDVIKELSKAKEKPITYEEGEELSKEINAECYLECSTSLGKGVEDFQKAAEIASTVFMDCGTKKKKCLLM